MQVQIKHRWNDSVLYTAEIPEGTPSGMQMRVALEMATAADANLTGAILTGAILTGAILTGANLTRANLTDANLAGANLTSAILMRANLTGADLTRANLTAADLAGAILTRANLTGADLAGADLTRAILTRADLTGAKWRNGIVINKTPIQLYGPTWAVTILDAHMQIGCELHSLAEWAEFDDDRIVQMDRQALRFWRAHKDALLSLARGFGRSFETAVEAVTEKS